MSRLLCKWLLLIFKRIFLWFLRNLWFFKVCWFLFCLLNLLSLFLNRINILGLLLAKILLNFGIFFGFQFCLLFFFFLWFIVPLGLIFLGLVDSLLLVFCLYFWTVLIAVVLLEVEWWWYISLWLALFVCIFKLLLFCLGWN